MLHEAVDKVKEGLLLHLNLEMKKAISMIEATMDKIQLEVKTFAVDHARIDEIKDNLKAAFTGYDFKIQDAQEGSNTINKVELVDRLTFNENEHAHRRMRSLKQNPSKPVLDFEMQTFEENSQPRSLRSTSRPNLNESPKNKEFTENAEVKSAWGPGKKTNKPEQLGNSSKSNYEAKFHQFFSKNPIDKPAPPKREHIIDSVEQTETQIQIQSVSKDQDSFTTPLPEPPSTDVNEFFNTEMDKIIKHYLSDTSGFFPKNTQPQDKSPMLGQRKKMDPTNNKHKQHLAFSVPMFHPPAPQDEEVRLHVGEGTDPLSGGMSQSTPNPKRDIHREPSHYQSLVGLGQATQYGFIPKEHSPIPNKAYYTAGASKRTTLSGMGGSNAFINHSSKWTSSSQRLPSHPTKKSRSRSNAQLQQSVGKKAAAQLPIQMSGSVAAGNSYKQRFEDL